LDSILAKGFTPPWLPRDVAEARRFAYYGQFTFFGMAALWFIVVLVSLVAFVIDGGRGLLGLAVFGFFAMIVAGLSGIYMKRTVIDAIDQGRFHDAKNDSVIWIFFGLFAFVLPSLLMLLAYAKLGDALAAQAPAGYSPYGPGAVAVQQPGQYVPPPAPMPPPPQPQQAPPPAHAAHAATPMYRCKNCNVQFPMFMHSCPNCGAPKQ
jgi:hypothetical protein